MPLCVGPFVEIKEDFDTITRNLVRYAASKEVGNKVSLLASSFRWGGSFSIMLQQFRLAIATTIAQQKRHLMLQSPTTAITDTILILTQVEEPTGTKYTSLKDMKCLNSLSRGKISVYRKMPLTSPSQNTKTEGTTL